MPRNTTPLSGRPELKKNCVTKLGFVKILLDIYPQLYEVVSYILQKTANNCLLPNHLIVFHSIDIRGILILMRKCAYDRREN